MTYPANRTSRDLLAICIMSSWLIIVVGCSKGSSASEDDIDVVQATAESCMTCHNGANHDDYSGIGIENPHPFTGEGTLKCSRCHGGDPSAGDMVNAHVPPPPEIGDETFQENNALAYFNRLTQTGIERFPDYTVNGKTYTALEYLQFINPGDLRVVSQGQSCGECHMAHVDSVSKSLLATSAGIFSGATFAIGLNNRIPANQDLFEDTAADLGFRSAVDNSFVFDASDIGAIGQLVEFPVFSVRNSNVVGDIDRNQLYNSGDLPNDQLVDGRVISGSPLANLYHEQVAFTCGDCHLGSAGANNRYGDYRSSGCTACHMQYSLDGRSLSTDPNIKKLEPFDPDDIEAPERPHVKRHLITSVARTLSTGESVHGMDDYTCAGCHQGSNRTVMQYWGIRLDQNQDVRRGNQYPANPVSFKNTANDTRLFDPLVNNNTFNGRNANQYLLEEDYDGDGRDDTPADVHYDAGMGCIDCHGSHDLHGGTVGDPANSKIYSRQEQGVAIRCESCHGTVDAYADTTPGTTYSGSHAQVGVDSEGNAMRHVVLEDGEYFLYSRLTGRRHYVSQIKDVVVDSGKNNPLSGEPIYNAKASYAMGRSDGSNATGLGPGQSGGVSAGFSHMDNLSCSSCHSSWTNNCVGCHLSGEYNRGNNFSNITGQRIVFREDDAEFVYQSPVPFSLGIDTHNKIAPMAGNTQVFWKYTDLNNTESQIFSFSDRQAKGNNLVQTAHPSLSHNAMMPHSIRGKVSSTKEGPRYCVACHLTTDSIANFGADYDSFRTAMSTGDFASLDYAQLQTHIGQNPGNQLNSPFWVHMVAGLGSGLFLFDENGAPVNPLDTNPNRVGSNNVAPADSFDAALVFFNLDRMVTESGESAGSNNHAMLEPGTGPLLRDGATNTNMSGPLGASLIEKLAHPTNGIILDSWINADGLIEGDAALFIP